MSKVYNRIESITGNVITVKAADVRYNELAQINTRFGKSLAQVNKIDGDIVSLQVFAGGQGISTGDEVRFLGHDENEHPYDRYVQHPGRLSEIADFLHLG